MAKASLMPYGFVSAVDSTDILFNDGGATGGAIFNRVRGVNLGTSAMNSVITLPNGARYRINQNYATPRALGQYSFTVAYFDKSASSVYDNYLETLYGTAYALVGHPGTLSAYRVDNFFSGSISLVEATAVLQRIDASWSGKKFDYSLFSGEKLQHLDIQFFFEMVTDWP